MAFTTKALSFFYKRLGPTGSNATTFGYLPQYWFTASNSNVSSAFLNYPTDGVNTYLTTRNTASNATYRALPWGSHACDFLWNVLVPSWSYANRESTYGGSTFYGERLWNYTYISKSFHKENYPAGSTYGVSTYPVTSSWKMVDAKLGPFSYVYGVDTKSPVAANSYPAYVGSTYPPAYPPVDTSGNIAYDITYPNITNNATSSIDKQYFDVGTGAGISAEDIYLAADDRFITYNDNTPAGLATFTEALKTTRLYFPIPVSGSGTTGGTDYWFKTFTGYTAAELFNENGGIYNVQFTLKRYTTASYTYQPDSNTYLSAFIHNVIPQAPSSSARIPGADGWYPPENNIVRIGNGWNGTPVLSFYDAQTGYLVEKFNFNLIQYGYPAQFCLEPSSDYDSSLVFGIIVSDIEICKIGVTTDPKFIKPTTVTQTIINQTTVGTAVYDPYIPS